MSLAFQWFFNGKNLVILLYFELFKQLADVDQLYIALLGAQNANKMLIIFFKTHQRTTTFDVGLDNQLKIDSLYLSQHSFVVVISQFYKTLVSHHGIFMRPDVEETDHSTLLSHNHNRMDGRESNIDYSASHNQNPFKLQFLYIPYIDSPIITTCR